MPLSPRRILKRILISWKDKWKDRKAKAADRRPYWLQGFNPALPVVIVVRPREDAPHAIFDLCVEALGSHYNILLCVRKTRWKYIRRAIRSLKISSQNVQGIFFSQRPNRGLLRSCRRYKILNICLSEIDEPRLVRQGVCAADKVVYASKAIFEAMSIKVFLDYPVALTIPSQLDDLSLLGDELVKIIKLAHLRFEQRQRDVEFLLAHQPIDLAYWSGRRDKLRLSRKDAVRYLREWQPGHLPLRPIAGFHPGIYAEHHDLTLPGGMQADPFIHYLQAGCPQGRWNWPVLRENVPLSEAARQRRVALHIHAFYVEMLPDIIKRLQVNIIRPDLYISVTDEASKIQAQSYLANYEAGCTIRIVPNRGRDIGPLLTEFGAELVENYDIIGHIHTKQTKHKSRRIVERWRVFLLDNLLGDGRRLKVADTIIETMTVNPQIMICFPDDTNAVGWAINRAEAERLAPRLGIKMLPNFINYPVGTMFWVCSSWLRRFVELKLDWQDYPAEPIANDGTILHAIERLFALAPENAKEAIVEATVVSGKKYR